MRKNAYQFICLGLITMLIASCAPKVLFSEEARKQLEDSKVKLQDIQFYNDKEIVLQYKKDTSMVAVEEGIVTETDGRNLEEIRIPRSTPGIIEKYENEILYVRFEQEADRILRFKRNSYDMFQIDADRWYKGNGRITYANQTYLIKPVGNDALLLVRKSAKYKNSTKSSRAKGVKVGGK